MTPEQLTLDGGFMPVGSITDRIRVLLERHPEARDNYKALCVRYWRTFDGLDEVLLTDPRRFTDWFVTVATSPKTIQNRCLEVQREYPELDARPKIRSWRDKQATAGPVGS